MAPFPAFDKEQVKNFLFRHVTALSVEIGPRSLSEIRNLNRASAYIRSEMEKMGLKPQAQEYLFQGEKVGNILATFDADSADRHFLIGAHYDSVPGTPGADDNASGVAVALETVRILSGPGFPLPSNCRWTLAAFTLEESPAFGSREMGSAVCAAELKRSGIHLDGAIVLEMVGFYSDYPGSQDYPEPVKALPHSYPDTGNFVVVVGNEPGRRLTETLVSAMKRNPGLPVELLVVPGDGSRIPETRLSDHSSFWDAGFPAVMVTDTSFFRNPNYHLPSDTIQTLNFDRMAEVVRSLLLFSAQAGNPFPG